MNGENRSSGPTCAEETKKGHKPYMLDIAREEQSNPVELKFFRGTTGANVVADATLDADQTLWLRSTVPHFSQYPYIGLGHSYKHSALLCTT
jgi:hypothetical protein